jgi:hypothetical protein
MLRSNIGMHAIYLLSRLPELVADLLRRRVDVLVALATNAGRSSRHPQTSRSYFPWAATPWRVRPY